MLLLSILLFYLTFHSQNVVCFGQNVVDVGRAKAKISVEEMLKLHRKRRDDDKLFSINSPRRNDDKPESVSNNGNTRGIHIKLPDDIGEQMAKGQRERTRLRDALLGFPASLEPTSISTSTIPETTYHDLIDEAPEHKISHPKQQRTWEEQLESVTISSPIPTYTKRPTKKLPKSTTPRPILEEKNYEVAKKLPPSIKNHKSIWRIVWDAHIYFSGTLFVLLAIYCSVNILRLHTFSRLFSRNYFVSLNLCLVLIGILRPIWLFYDPYNVGNSWTRPVAYLLVDTGLPCMTSAFAVLFLALLRATQIELVSPAFQTPRALTIFCFLHFGLSVSVDVTIGLYFNLRYMVLILQGVFIVWSLLLSAGYFYIFSALNKVAMRQQGDIIRSVYPKLILEGGTAYSENGQMQPLSSAVLKKPPLARAVHLTLGVAVLGSLLGGVQLFAMIKMLALIKQDMSPNQNEWAWYGYQVSMRILEVTLCTLLAIIATTPLRYDQIDNGLEASPGSTLDEDSSCCFGSKRNRHRSRKTKSKICCCCNESNPPQEFEDEIYSEICSNNHSVRQVMGDTNPYAGANTGTMMALGTLSNAQPNMLAMGSNTLMPYHKRTAASYASQSATLLRSSNHSYNGAFQVNNHRTSSGGVQASGTTSAINNSSTSSRATLDTQLYSNIRSRPSSMLFNDSGFVRFRMGNDASEPHIEMVQQPQPTTSSDQDKIIAKKKLRASQSFDEAVLGQDDSVILNGKSPIYHTTSDPEAKDEEEDDIEPELEAIYEPPPSNNRIKKQSLTTPSESDEPTYNMSIYGRAPSQCSSISATQSFDLRMYGRLPKNTANNTAAAVAAVIAGAGPLATGTLRKNQEQTEKLENPYYYYGSTRNQKKAKMIAQQQKPRPLLPSQRAALEMQQRAPAFVATQLPGERPKSRQQDAKPPSRPSSRQALLQHELQEQQNFTRSRSLGGYYQQQQHQPPLRNQHHPRGLPPHPHLHHQGSMTPVSYAKWQHHQNQVPKKYNPLYDTPPTQRAAMVMRPQGLQNVGEIRGVMGVNASPLLNHQPHLRPQRPLLTEPVLSPILTDTEISPLHRTGLGSAPDYLTDPSDSDDAEMFTSQATQGYSEGLADNEQESEVSSIFGIEPGIPNLPQNGEPHVSPLEYSAMLKLYRSGIEASNGSRRTHLKDTTPDSGVVADNSHSNSNQSTTSSQAVSRTVKDGSSQNSLLSSASSTAEQPIWQIRNPTNQPNSTQNHGKEYSRVENQPDTLFSSSGSSSENGDETTDKPAFRWDGTPLVDTSKESQLLKKVKSLTEEEKNPPKPPIRDSSRKREEIK